MKSVLFKSAVFALSSLTLFTSGASAQPFLEFSVQGAIYDPDTSAFMPFQERCVVDISAPIRFTTTIATGYNCVDSESVDFSINDSPVLTAPTSSGPIVGSDVVYCSLDEVLILRFRSNTVNMIGMQGDFSNALVQLPGDPEEYRIDANIPSAGITVNPVFAGGVFGILRWTPGQGFFGVPNPEDYSGGFTVSVREVQDPSAELDCLVDLNNDGELDFFDVSAFLQLFAMGCP